MNEEETLALIAAPMYAMSMDRLQASLIPGEPLPRDLPQTLEEMRGTALDHASRLLQHARDRVHGPED